MLYLLDIMKENSVFEMPVQEKDPRFFFESIADRFDDLHNWYDLERRLAVIFDEMLTEQIAGERMLDLGCGSGWFSRRAVERGASLISLDISESLARITSKSTGTDGVTGEGGLLPFSPQSFDIVVSSEVLEHMDEPERGIKEVERVLKPGGVFVMTTPNRRWLWLVNLATRLKLRPYEGYENFLGFTELRLIMADAGLNVEQHFGFHPWPFQITFMQRLSTRVDQRFGRGLWGRYMINQAIFARRGD